MSKASEKETAKEDVAVEEKRNPVHELIGAFELFLADFTSRGVVRPETLADISEKLEFVKRNSGAE